MRHLVPESKGWGLMTSLSCFKCAVGVPIYRSCIRVISVIPIVDQREMKMATLESSEHWAHCFALGEILLCGANAAALLLGLLEKTGVEGSSLRRLLFEHGIELAAVTFGPHLGGRRALQRALLVPAILARGTADIAARKLRRRALVRYRQPRLVSVQV